MKKATLMEMRKLTATPSMMKGAEADELKERKRVWWGNEKGYHIGIYLRCVMERDILKVAIFLTEHMKAGGNLPVYELYIDKKNMTFITYDCIKKKWFDSKLDRINWPRYVAASSNDWISNEDYTLIKRHLETKEGGYDGLLAFQRRVREYQLEERHKRITGAWDKVLEQTRDLPKDWNLWVQKVGIPENHIFYRYERKGAKSGYCSYCEKEVPIKNPRHNKPGKCPRCHHDITFKSMGKMGSFFTERVPMYLIQRCKSGFMVREFLGYKHYYRGDYKNPYIHHYEVRRAIYDHNAKPITAFYWGVYKQRNSRWIECSVCTARSFGWEYGRVYGKALPVLYKRELLRTGFREHLQMMPNTDPERYLAISNMVPHLEQIQKANLPVLARECLQKHSDYQHFFSRTEETSLIRAMGIDAPRMKRLRERGKGIDFLRWLRYEKQKNITLSDALIDWFCKNGAKPENFSFLNEKMSMVQIYNYMNRQMTENSKDYAWVKSTWEDTLSMAKKLRLNLDDPYVFRPGDLHGRHQEYVGQINKKGDEILANELEYRFPRVNEICAAIKPLYTYEGTDYIITVPKGILDIVKEGRSLSHCVGKSDRYLDRIERRESYVLFLRKRKTPQKSYYTLEVEPDGTVRQKRTVDDVQNDDIELATEFLRKWQAEISKRLTSTERTLAIRSRELRQEQFAQLRKSNTIIYTGALRGHRLLDVLLADLMENAEVAAAPGLAAAA